MGVCGTGTGFEATFNARVRAAAGQREVFELSAETGSAERLLLDHVPGGLP